eukprot:bmy_21746T0
MTILKKKLMTRIRDRKMTCLLEERGLSPYFLHRCTQHGSHWNYSKLEDSGGDTG